MRFSFSIEIPDKRGIHENSHIDFLKAASKQLEEALSYANSREGKRLMTKLKEKAGCSEMELVQECWEATDEILGRKSNAVIGDELLASPASKASDPFSNVTKSSKPEAAPKPASVPELEEEEGEDEPEELDEEAVEPAELEADEDVEDEEESAPPPRPGPRFPMKKSLAPPSSIADEEEVEEISEDEPEEEEEEATAPKPPAKMPKFPFKKLPRKGPPPPLPAPEQTELIPDDEENGDEEDAEDEVGEDEVFGSPPSAPAKKLPFKGAGPQRPAKGMTGFAKKGSPFKKMPFKKMPPGGG